MQLHKKETYNNFRKTISTVILLFAVFIFWGCEKEKVSIPEEVDQVSTLDWYINFSWYSTEWGSDAVSQDISDLLDVNVDFSAPIGNETDKLDSMIAMDQMPDLITMGWWENQMDTLIDSGKVYALNELADQYGVDFTSNANPDAYSWYQQSDGNIYAYPNSFYMPQDYENYKNISSNQTFLVRKDIYEAIGSPDMTTPEGFSDAVRKAAQEYPTVNGNPLIPIGAHEFTDTGCDSFDKFLQNFLAVPYEKDGQFFDRYTDESYITWLKMFRQLGEEGYLKDEIFTDQRVQMEEKLAKGQYFCMLYQWKDLADQEKILYAKDPDSIYIAIDGPKNLNQDDYVLPGNGINGWTVTMITKACKDPQKAIELLNYLISPQGQWTTYMGIEGVTYDVSDGQAVTKSKVENLLNIDREAYDKKYGADNTYWMLQDEAMQLQWKKDLTEPLGQLESWTYPYTHYLGQYEITFDPGSQEEIDNRKIQNLWGKTLVRLLLADSETSFDDIFDDFLHQRQALGYDKVMEASTEKMKEAEEKLGLE